MRNPNTTAGFTIIELLVAAAVFVTVITMVIDLFLLFLRSNYEQNEQEQLEQSISYVFHEVSNHLHGTGAIDFSQYGSITNPQTELYLTNLDNFETDRFFLGTGTPPNEEAGQIYFEDTVTGDIEPVTPDPVGDIYVDSLEFYIYPSSDPADVTTSALANNQPAVVMRITAHVSDDSTMTATYQSLITSRYYAR